MKSRSRARLVLLFAALLGLAQADLACAQKFNFGGGSNNNNNNNNSNNNDNNRNNDGGGRRNRNRNDDEQNNTIQLGGSDAQKVQQAIQGFQGNSGKQNQFDGQGQGGQFKNGKQFKNSQQWQNWQHQNGQGNWKKNNKKDWQNWAIQFGGPAPFSNKWYKNHPNAWHHHHHHDNDWEIATAAGVIGWLGWQSHPYNTTVIYEPVPVETIYVQGGPAFDPNAPGEWMLLGVYSLLTGPGDSGTRTLELAVDKYGRIRGNYYDMITGGSFTVTGRIDQATQHVQWSVDNNKQLRFFAHLSQLTQPQGAVNVRFAGGQQQQWQLERIENGN